MSGRSAGANLTEAFARVWTRPWLLLALALTNVGLSVILSSPLSAMLSTLLDHRPAAAAMAAGDDGVWIELLTDHLPIFAVASAVLASGVILYGLWCWILDGGVLAALAFDGERRARGAAEVLAESVRRAPRMIRLGLFGLGLRVVPLGCGAAAFAIAHAVITGRTFQPNLTMSMVALGAAAVVWSALSVAIDYARGLSLDDPETRSWRLVARGCKLVFQRRSASLQLIAFSMAAWLAVGVGCWLLGSHLGPLVLLTMLRLFAVVARAAITLTTLTAAARVARA